MSYGAGLLGVDTVMPSVSFGSIMSGFQDPAVGAVRPAYPDTAAGAYTPELSVPDLGSALPDISVSEAGGQALDAVLDQAQDLLVPALIGLGSLSGALLAGRAAMAGAQALAAAAIRAAESQRTLRTERLDACQAAECWRQAAYAAAATNARIEALHARVRRAAGTLGPPDPDLPPPLAPVGMTLEQIWRQLADTEKRLRQAETAHALQVLEAAARPPAVTATADPHASAVADWHRELRDRRARALADHQTPDRLPPLPDPSALTPATVLALGKELLAALPLQASVADHRLIEEKIVTAAEEATAGRAAAARRHLREAEHFTGRATRAAERRQLADEWAAQQLGFLRGTPSGPAHEGTPAIPAATDEIALLERALYGGAPLDDAERTRITARVAERTTTYQRLYAAEMVRTALRQTPDGARLRDRPAARSAPPGGPRPSQVIDWTPPGWGDEHWLRLILEDENRARVVTLHRPRPAGTETPADRELDRVRCAEAPRHLRTLERLLGDAKVTMRLAFAPQPEEAAPVSAAAATEPRRGEAPRVRRRGDRP
ncbi:hypothetical protein [Streptomyces yaizuensis]|uniref:Uncharacterized protein n=1 Tax=Streptomyces yaizuensis TaxID=2989713 RepID=A0ABQ5P1V1_9ACTN|nr:hypothetical protein [Streptomyces sp. YSPA8]GLF96580.1 hypothetical protein SYYSPA8_19805 [Streptomyces sp. YSPA8]